MEKQVNVSALAEVIARDVWIRENALAHGAKWAEDAWEDMGGSEPSSERAELISHYYLLLTEELRSQGAIPPREAWA